MGERPFSTRQKVRKAEISGEIGVVAAVPLTCAESAINAPDIVPMIQYCAKCLKHSSRKEVRIGRLDY